MRDPLDVATRIGLRLARTAIWNGDQCAWESVPTGKRPDLTMPWHLDPTVYRGTAGVGIFLAELYGETGDLEVLRAARGALRHAKHHGGSISLHWSAYSGLVGLAYALARLATVAGDDQAAEDVRALWRRLEPMKAQMPGDIITGAAGAIPLLMQLAPIVERHAIERVVYRLATAIQEGAVHTVDGTAWRGVPTAHRPLTGFAHGASGYAYALLGAWQYCNSSRFLYTALQAMLYERRAYDDWAIGNWPDFRHSEFGKVVWEIPPGRFQSMVRSGWDPGPYEVHGMHAWCHGSPGIGLVRLRAAERLGLPWLWREAEMAAAATVRSLDREDHNWSLCHGVSGNCEFLLEAATVLGRDDLRERVLSLAELGDDSFEGRGVPWPSGTVENATHPGLLIGDAGVGLHYLRLAAPHVPSVLFPPLSIAKPGVQMDLSDAHAYRNDLARALFRHTSAVAGADAGALLSQWDLSDATSDLATIASRVREHAGTRDEPAWQQAAARDLACVQPGTRQLSDMETRMDDLLALPPEEIEWSRARFRPRASVALHDVDAEAGDGAAAFMVKSNLSGHVTIEELKPLSALVLDAYAVGASMDDVITRIAGYVDGKSPARLRALVEQQTRSAYVAGVLTCAPEPQHDLAVPDIERTG